MTREQQINAIGVSGALAMLLGIACFDWRVALIVGGSLALVGAIFGALR